MDNAITALPDIGTVKLGPADRAIGRIAKVKLFQEPEGDAQRDLAGDLFHEMFQHEPKPTDEIPAERGVNRALLDWMKETHGWEQSRTSTVANMPASMTSAALMWSYLTSDEAMKEALKEQEKADEAAKQQRQAERAADIAQQMADATGDPGTQAQADQLRMAAADAGQAAADAAAAAQEIVDKAKNSPYQTAKLASAAKDAAEKGRKVAEAMAGWGMGPGSSVYTNPDSAMKFLEANTGTVAQIAELAGRMRGFALTGKQERTPVGVNPINAEYTRKFRQMFPLERAKLLPTAAPATRAKAILQYTKIGMLGFKLTADAEKRGPFVGATDVSPSMRGARDIVAKAVALGVGQVARQDNRPYLLFSFASDEGMARKSFVTGEDDWPKHIEWASAMHSGGTDFNMALRISMEHLRAMGKRGLRPDLLFISDMEAGVNASVAEEWRKFKEETGARLFVVPVGRGYDKMMSGWSLIQDVADEVLYLDEIDEQAGTDLAQRLGGWM